MAVIKCEMCGGELEFNDNATVVVCKYCGTKQTIGSFENTATNNVISKSKKHNRKNQTILNRVEQYKYKRGISFIDSDSGIFKVLKVFFTLFFAWAIVMNLLTVLSWSLRIGNESFKYVAVSFYTLLTCSILTILGFIFVFTKLKYIGLGLSSIISVFTVISYAPLLQDATKALGYKTIFFTRHLIPHAGIILLSIIMLVILLISFARNNNLYKKIEKTIYEEYVNKKEKENLLSTWEEYLDSIK